MKDKPKKYTRNLRDYKLKPLKPILYKISVTIGIILIILLLQSLNFKSTKWAIAKVKYATEYKVDIKTSSSKLYNGAKNSAKKIVKESGKRIPVFNMSLEEKYVSPINGEVYRAYEQGTNEGVDIKSIDEKDPKSIIEGKVKEVYLQEKQGYFVTIQDGDIEITYGYLSKSYVSEGEDIDIETPIGSLGTNKDENKYLRIEFKTDGEYKNPLDYIDLKQ